MDSSRGLAAGAGTQAPAVRRSISSDTGRWRKTRGRPRAWTTRATQARTGLYVAQRDSPTLPTLQEGRLIPTARSRGDRPRPSARCGTQFRGCARQQRDARGGGAQRTGDLADPRARRQRAGDQCYADHVSPTEEAGPLVGAGGPGRPGRTIRRTGGMTRTLNHPDTCGVIRSTRPRAEHQQSAPHPPQMSRPRDHRPSGQANPCQVRCGPGWWRSDEEISDSDRLARPLEPGRRGGAG